MNLTSNIITVYIYQTSKKYISKHDLSCKIIHSKIFINAEIREPKVNETHYIYSFFCRNKKGKNYPFMEIPKTISPIRDEKKLPC